ncbi:hypothetical protein NYZ99_18690 [Maribacter litopenaei]|uniref:Uncharacterized protein n=1 Tax=Maribacter litopenaei TaxID=2976127 RepID=A0ABY5Y6Z1_9FLAO|nr:hypothetical protein [Maribacter litopenaei]UWX54793.1 hypothetical protein NYZ99_18690 [Maribacter litopenaei]
MGFGFHSMPVIKANKALLKKRRSYGDIRAEYEGLTSKTKLKFKDLSPLQQKVIKDRIREQAKKDDLYNFWVMVISIMILLSLIIFLYARYMV